jgi:hypothetical protein
MHRISQWSSEAFKRNLHNISIFQLNTRSKTQALGAEEVHVNVTRAAVRRKLKVMVLHILQAVAHLILPGAELR